MKKKSNWKKLGYLHGLNTVEKRKVSECFDKMEVHLNSLGLMPSTDVHSIQFLAYPIIRRLMTDDEFVPYFEPSDILKSYFNFETPSSSVISKLKQFNIDLESKLCETISNEIKNKYKNLCQVNG